MVQWEAPYSLLYQLEQPEIALFRLGVASNTNAVISKTIVIKPSPPPPPSGPLSSPSSAKGTLTFYAPRSAGVFVFRMFDGGDPAATHGTSHAFVVEVQGRDVEGNLRLISTQLRERKTVVAGLSQLGVLLKELRPMQPGRQFNTLLWTCLQWSVKQIKEGGEEEGKEGEKTRSRYPIIAGVASVLQAALGNRFVFSCLDAGQRAFLLGAEALWCPFNEEFFPSPAAKHAHYLEQWQVDFIPTPLDAIPPSVIEALTVEMNALLPALYPSATFFQTREEVRQRIEALLPSLGDEIFPPGTRLRVFGSSANNFGNDAADLDMCVTFPNVGEGGEGGARAGGAAGAGDMIEALAALLEEEGMEDVVPRPTARIPIVLFTDPKTGLDCDISVENPLALRNTQLLHQYSRIDPRVRALAYTVKHWARARKINNASGGTLSSYAYILMVLHFLQSAAAGVGGGGKGGRDGLEPVPVVPNLQLLPPDWGGREVDRRELLRGRRHLPHVLVKHPLEGVEVDTYFYTEDREREGGGAELLKQYAKRNEASVGALLVTFFQYYTWEFDYREHVLSVRMGGLLRKEEKAEEDGWAVNSRLAVEDPFETWYNVTHFLKEGKHRHIRQEFARAYALCVEEGSREHGGGKGGGLLARICEEAPDPPMRKQTMEDEEGLLLASMQALGIGGEGGEKGKGKGEREGEGEIKVVGDGDGEGGQAVASIGLPVNAAEGEVPLAVA